MRRYSILVALTAITFFSFILPTNNFELVKNLELYTNIFRELNTYYVDEIQPEKLTQTAINGMLKSLDPYSSYIPEENLSGYQLQTTGKYGGIGATIRPKGDYVIIAEPYEGFPAEKAGLRAGDKILTIDGKSAKNLNTAGISKLLKGAPNTKVVLEIERIGEEAILTKTFEREEIKIKSVPYSGMLDHNTGYIRLGGFTEKSFQEVALELNRLKQEHEITSLILDLRGNPGGLLSEAIDVAGVFLPKSTSIVNTKSKEAKWDKMYRTGELPVDVDIPLAVLIDRGSASASEIVAGVMQDLDRGIVIGNRSYGKGLVQTTKNVGYNSKLKLTTAKYYLPSGRCIQAVDYSGGYNDNLEKIPDSLRTAFYTTKGRKVFDAGGIDPDVEIKEEQYSNIAYSLIRKDLIFNYATQYRNQHAAIPTPEEFEFSDADFDAFVKFLKGKEYDYETESDRLLKTLEETITEEKYDATVKAELEALKTQIQHDKQKDLIKFKEEIKNALEYEIAARYFYQKGRIQEGLEDDKVIVEALKVLDTDEYKKLLKK